jgi:hypothetical protein
VPQRPEVAFALVTVLAELRRRGAGTALYEAISAWARERGLDTIQTLVADDDPESLDFALHRGFTEDGHQLGVSLDLTRIEPPAVEPPEGVQIVTWAARPELARGMYEVVLEAAPDIPAENTNTSDGASRPHRRQACLARPRHRACAEGDADRVGQGERL